MLFICRLLEKKVKSVNKKTYMISDELRIIDNGVDEIRFRVGIWNYNEAVVELSQESDQFKVVLREVVDRLRKEEKVEEQELRDERLEVKDKEALVQLFQGLNKAKILLTEEERLRGSAILDILAGEYKELGREKDREEHGKRRILYITDDEHSNQTIKVLSESMNLNIHKLEEEKLRELRKIDLTTKMDTLSYYDDMNKALESFQEFYGVMVCLRKPEVTLLRNLNRILIHLKKDAIISFIDGPFITAFGIKPPYTGCVECFEERILSKMEDHLAYEKFEKFTFDNKNKTHENKGYIPLVNLLSNLCASEAYLLSVLGTNKLQGRCLSIYIPSMEIQMQDLLKVPYCSACGAVATIKFKDLNINSRRIVDEIIDNINEKDKVIH